MDSACVSLLQVLHIYYAEPPKLGLHIITDTSLVIDKNIVVSQVSQPFSQHCSCGASFLFTYTISVDCFQEHCGAIISSVLHFSSLESGVNINISVIGIHIYLSMWEASNIDLLFSNCWLQTSLFVVVSAKSGAQVHLHISSSQIESYFNISDATAILENCTVFSTQARKDKSLINASNSTVIVNSLEVQMSHGGGFLLVFAGNTSILHSKFTNCALATVLIIVSKGASLFTDNCIFASNDGQLIAVENSSTAIVNNTVFQDNNVFGNSSNITFDLVRAIVDGIIVLENSHFVNNVVQTGAALGIIKSIGIIENSHFKNNTAGKSGALHVEFSRMIRINKSMFEDNRGAGVAIFDSSNIFISSSWFYNNSIGGGLFVHSKDKNTHNKIDKNKIKQLSESLYSSKYPINSNQGILFFSVHNCTFTNNFADFGGAISAVNMSLMLTKSTFTNNSVLIHLPHPGGHGSAVYLESSSTTISGCVFVGNLGISAGAIAARNKITPHNETLFITNSTFQANKVAHLAGAIFSELHTTIQASSFIENIATIGGAINMYSANITDCYFEANRANEWGGAIHIEPGSHVTISHTNFFLNEAPSAGAIDAGNNVSLSCDHCSFHGNKAGLR